MRTLVHCLVKNLGLAACASLLLGDPPSVLRAATGKASVVNFNRIKTADWFANLVASTSKKPQNGPELNFFSRFEIGALDQHLGISYLYFQPWNLPSSRWKLLLQVGTPTFTWHHQHLLACVGCLKFFGLASQTAVGGHFSFEAKRISLIRFPSFTPRLNCRIVTQNWMVGGGVTLGISQYARCAPEGEVYVQRHLFSPKCAVKLGLCQQSQHSAISNESKAAKSTWLCFSGSLTQVVFKSWGGHFMISVCLHGDEHLQQINPFQLRITVTRHPPCLHGADGTKGMWGEAYEQYAPVAQAEVGPLNYFQRLRTRAVEWTQGLTV